MLAGERCTGSRAGITIRVGEKQQQLEHSKIFFLTVNFTISLLEVSKASNASIFSIFYFFYKQ